MKKKIVIITSLIISILIISSGYGAWNRELIIEGHIRVEEDPEVILARQLEAELALQQFLAEQARLAEQASQENLIPADGELPENQIDVPTTGEESTAQDGLNVIEVPKDISPQEPKSDIKLPESREDAVDEPNENNGETLETEADENIPNEETRETNNADSIEPIETVIEDNTNNNVEPSIESKEEDTTSVNNEAVVKENSNNREEDPGDDNFENPKEQRNESEKEEATPKEDNLE